MKRWIVLGLGGVAAALALGGGGVLIVDGIAKHYAAAASRRLPPPQKSGAWLTFQDAHGFHIQVVIPSKTWIVSDAAAGGFTNSLAQAPQILISSSNGSNPFNFVAGVAPSTQAGSGLGVVRSTQTERAGVLWRIVSRKPTAAWGGATEVVADGYQGGQQVRQEFVTYKKVGHAYYFVEGGVGRADSAFSAFYRSLVNGFAIG